MKTRIVVLMLVVVLALFAVTPALAQGNNPAPKSGGEVSTVDPTVPIDPNIAVELLAALVFTAYVTMYTVQALKQKGIVAEGTAGIWNERVSFVIGLAGFFLVRFGAGAQIDSAKAAAPLLAPGIAFVIANIVMSKTLYEIIKWTRGQQALINKPKSDTMLEELLRA